MITKNELHEKLAGVGYCSTEEIDTALMMSGLCGMPLLVEGDPGTGKTYLGESLAKALGFGFIRLQMYDGLTDDKILYDYDYQRQLLSLEAIKPVLEREFKDMGIQDAIRVAAKEINFYGPEFLIERPILKSITGKDRYVLLIDEIDKASEENEYMLYEFLENYSISIPQYGTIQCPEDKRPIVILTSNRYRELSGALKRRCAYLYMKRKNIDEMTEIIMTQANVDEKLARGIAKCLDSASSIPLKQYPSISEGINWAKYLKSINPITKEEVLRSSGMVVKNYRDMEPFENLVRWNGVKIWGEEPSSVVEDDFELKKNDTIG